MPAWIHERAEHILAKNPSMPKSEAFAIATQQSHAVGKSPKGYGTEEGRSKAKSKYKTPGDDKKKANPGNLKSEKMAMDLITMKAFADELTKIAGTPPPLPAAAMKPKTSPMGDALFKGMQNAKSNPMPSVIPKTAGAPVMPVPKMKGLAGSGTPSMPMPKPSVACP